MQASISRCAAVGRSTSMLFAGSNGIPVQIYMLDYSYIVPVTYTDTKSCWSFVFVHLCCLHSFLRQLVSLVVSPYCLLFPLLIYQNKTIYINSMCYLCSLSLVATILLDFVYRVVMLT